MAFASGTLIPLSSSANSSAGKVWLYKEDATLAAIRADSYLDDAYPAYGFVDGDILMIIANDGFGFSELAVSSAGVVTVGEGLTSA